MPEPLKIEDGRVICSENGLEPFISVTALLADRNQHPWTNLALDALWMCLGIRFADGLCKAGFTRDP